MAIDIRLMTPAELETFRALVHDPSLESQFDKFAGADGFEHKLHDPKLARDGVHLAWVDGEPAGVAFAWWLESAAGPWAMCRVGVRAPWRRCGVGRALAEAQVAWLRAHAAGRRLEIATSAWLPADGAGELAARLGMAHERWFWLMTRPRGGASAPAWPTGVTVRAFDGSAAMHRDWDGVYNDSFAQHYRFTPSTPDESRQLAADPTFRADGLLLAYRDGACAGFCRNVLHEHRGEIAVLGVAQAARGLGLGRALLRWGVHWLETNSTTPVSLIVDGENENALGLYRSERLEVTRTREIWGRAFAGEA